MLSYTTLRIVLISLLAHNFYVLLGCRSSKESLEDSIQKEREIVSTKNLVEQADYLWDLARANASHIRNVDGKGTVTMNFGGKVRSLPAVLRIGKGEATQLTVTVFLGFVAFDMLLTRDTVSIYNGLNGSLLVGQATGENIEKASRIYIPVDYLEDLMLGALSLDDKSRDDFTFKVIERGMMFLKETQQVTYQIEIDSLLGMVTLFTISDKMNNRKVAITFSEFEKVDIEQKNVFLPKKINFISTNVLADSARSPQKFSFDYHSRVYNSETFKIRFSPPANAERIILD